MSVNAKQEAERAQFINHDMNQVGVILQIRSHETGELSLKLLGDLTPSGLDDGCCSSGIADEDVVVRYYDARPLIASAVESLSV